MKIWKTWKTQTFCSVVHLHLETMDEFINFCWLIHQLTEMKLPYKMYYSSFDEYIPADALTIDRSQSPGQVYDIICELMEEEI